MPADHFLQDFQLLENGRCVFSNQDKVLVVGFLFRVNWAIFHWTMMMKGCNVYTQCDPLPNNMWRRDTLWHESWKWNWFFFSKTVAQASRCLPYEHVSAHVAWPLLNPWFFACISLQYLFRSLYLLLNMAGNNPPNHQERAPFRP